MKKLFLLATAALLVTGIAFADNGKTNLEVLTHHHIPASKNEIIASLPKSMATAQQILESVTDE